MTTDFESFTNVAESLDVSIQGLQGQFAEYRKEQQKQRVRDYVIAGVVVLLLVAGTIFGLLFANAQNTKDKFNKACALQAQAAQSTIDFYNNLLTQQTPTIEQLRAQPPNTVIVDFPGTKDDITVGEDLKLIDQENASIKTSIAQLTKVVNAC